jgi:glycine/D-amino acid oxidase-like deaminating enzyme
VVKAVTALPRTADVVVIGGGAVGVSIAYHLAERGVRSILVLERDQVGAGSTSKAAGGVRVQFPLPQEVAFSLHSLRVFTDFESVIGQPAEFKRAGYLYLLTETASVEHFHRLREMQCEAGADVRWLTSVADIAEIVPDVFLEDVVAATFCPDEGYAGPAEVVAGFAQRARSMGVQILEGMPVTGFEIARDQIAAVRTPAGVVATETVVNAAGPWARPLAALAGLSLPVFPRRRHIFVTDQRPDLHHPLPMTTDRATGFYCRSELQSILMSPGDVGPRDEFEVPAVDWRWMEVAVRRAVHRLPSLEHASVTSAWVGLRPLTPDEHCLLGREPTLGGMFHAVGFCGHGFQHSPAAGLAMAELIVDGRCSSLDVTPFDPARFPTGAALRSAETGEAD